MGFHVTAHALQRYAERIAPVSEEEALARIMQHSRAIEAAVAMGCSSIRLGSGARLILADERVVTVLSANQRNTANWHDLEKRRGLAERSALNMGGKR